ncbi:MAG: elongation factor P maturation arginine rhamnosyltransferase EarP [Burkholderiales bacterium]
MPTASIPPPTTPLRWDVFCRVIDNLGDLGLCWRLCADLAGRGHQVRLWCDDASALPWMAPQSAAGVQVLPWRDPLPWEQPGDVVIEAFGCDPPPAFVERMAASASAPVWINLEYLSAEAYVARSHGLPSPQGAGPGRGLTKWFYYPGFTQGTGGLLREPGLLARRGRFDRDAFLARHGARVQRGERVVSVFCYDIGQLPALLGRLSPEPALLLVCAGPTQVDVMAAAGNSPGLRSLPLPWLTQPDYDHLLWSCDLNLVRGEDSFVRAQWAGAPFLWQVYWQQDGAHAPKLEAFLQAQLAHVKPRLADRMAAASRAWNGMAAWPEELPALDDWAVACRQWRDELEAEDDLTSQLLAFIARRRDTPSG